MLKVEVRGEGPPLVLLHGWAMHTGVFGVLAARLGPRFTLHLVDLPGHGWNRDSALPLEPEAVVEALSRQLPRGALWAGWSLGGLFALHAAATRPELVSGLAMICATPRFVRGDDWPRGMPPEVFRGFADGLRQDWRATVERFIALEAFGSEDARGEIRALREEAFARGEPAPRVLADGLDLLESADLRASLPALGVPTLWLAGRRDRLVDPRAMAEAAGRVADARVAVLEHAGHAPFLTHADAVAAELRALGERVFGAGAGR